MSVNKFNNYCLELFKYSMQASTDTIDLMPLLGDEKEEKLTERLTTSRELDEEALYLPEPELIQEEAKLISADEQAEYDLVDGFDKEFFDVKADPVEGGIMCDSCYSEYDEKDFFALACGHKFCINCNRDHLQTRI